MAKPATRKQLIDYALRRLGSPVIQINVDPVQLEDRLDDALQFYSEYHEDGIERTIFKHQVTDAEAAFGITSGWLEFDVPDHIFSVTNVFPFSDGFSDNFFDVRYQMLLNDLPNWSHLDLVGYTMNRSYWALLDNLLNQPTNYEFKKVQNKLKVYINTNGLSSGTYILFEAHAIIDPNVYSDIFNSLTLKKYLTALIKKQWGSNLSKFNNVTLPGGVSFNGEQLYQQAQEEISEIEESLRNRFPPGGFLG